MLLLERYQDTTPELTQYMDAQPEADSEALQDIPHAEAPGDSYRRDENTYGENS